jgi:predicted PurR-regulated permease PerM
MRTLEDRTFLFVVIVVSIGFGWILWPFSGAVLWGVILAIVFASPHRRLREAMGQRRNLAALAAVIIIVAIVILPLSAVGGSLAQEAGGFFKKIQSGEINLAKTFQQVLDVLPTWATNLMDRFGIASLSEVQSMLSAGVMRGGEYLTTKALNIGAGTLDFTISLVVMLYLLFFLFRDGDRLARHLRAAIPLRAEQQNALLSKFTAVIRATVKGNMLIALLQGVLGGVMFWFLGIGAPLLWTVLMAFLSLLPAVGAGLVWGPAAIYLLATGAIWQGVLLIAYGIFVIGLVDNLLRPVLVGKDTKMPDYLVLISTIGGIEAFGLSGFVIGPVIAALFITVWDIFSESRRDATAPQGDGIAPPLRLQSALPPPDA